MFEQPPRFIIVVTQEQAAYRRAIESIAAGDVDQLHLVALRPTSISPTRGG